MTKQETWDAIVIGAGPAGAIAARQLALSQRHVLLVDAKAFPRSKVCGGCVGVTALSVLRTLGLLDRIEPLAGPRLDTFHLSGSSGQIRWKLPGGRAISRATFDTELVRAAIEAGVVFRDQSPAEVQGVEQECRVVQIHTQRLGGRIVIVADGLARSSLGKLPEFKRRVQPASRIGVGTLLESHVGRLEPGTIYMAYGRAGYVGMVEVEAGQLNIAAAICPDHVSACRHVGSVVARILNEAHFPSEIDFQQIAWRGTPALSHAGNAVAAERLIVVGDSASYVEPFTGEGIGWAMLAGTAAAALSHRAIDRWRSHYVAEWRSALRSAIGRQQSVCRLIAELLRHPRIANGMLRVLAAAPSVFQPIVDRVP